VGEHELLVAFDRRHRLSPDQVTTLERAEEGREMLVLGECAPPEHLAADSSLEKKRALLGGKSVKASSDEVPASTAEGSPCGSTPSSSSRRRSWW